ncbi:MAG: PTS sugar transporter subunit IIC [Bradymonadia bacterium]
MNVSALAIELVLITLAGAFVCLDRRGAFQLMISQPLVVVPVMGLALGDVGLGLWIGAILQLLWVSNLQVGTNVPPNETTAAVVIGGMALLYQRHCVGVQCTPVGTDQVNMALSALAVLIGAPVSMVARSLDVRIDRANLSLVSRADEAAKAGAPRVITWLLFLGLARIFLSAVVVIAPALIAGFAAIMVIDPILSGPLRRALEVVGLYVIPALGFSVALSTLRRRRALVVAAASFVVALTVVMQQGEGV